MKGFTLIELLAVIVILAIILLIATPMVMNVIESSKRGAFESSSKMVVEAAELRYMTNDQQAQSFTVEDGAFVGDKIEMNGEVPGDGEVVINEQGQVAIAIHDGNKYCATKEFDGKLVVNEALEADCNIVLPATGPSYITLLLNELNSTITSNAQVDALDRTQLQTIISNAISLEPDLSVTNLAYNELVEQTGTDKDYSTELHMVPYTLGSVPNINTNEIILVNFKPTGAGTWKPMNETEYNVFAGELPSHEIVISWNGNSVHSSWDATVDTEVSTEMSYIGAFVLLAFNTTSNQFEVYLHLVTPI